MSPLWRGAGAAVVGPSHAKLGKTCEDAWVCLTRRGALVALVCDGAGSSAEGKAAARSTVSELSCRLVRLLGYPAPSGRPGLAALIARVGLEPLAVPALREALTAVLDNYRRDLLRKGVAKGYRPEDLRCTVVGVVAVPEGGCFLQIGDGAAAAAWVDDPAGPSAIISPPENGLLSNETYFLSDEDWREHLRLTPFPARDLVLLASDGAAPFVFRDGWHGLEPDFVLPMLRHLDGLPGRITRNRSLAAVLAHPDAAATSGGHDDKTLVWAQLPPVSAAAANA